MIRRIYRTPALIALTLLTACSGSSDPTAPAGGGKTTPVAWNVSLKMSSITVGGHCENDAYSGDDPDAGYGVLKFAVWNEGERCSGYARYIVEWTAVYE